ncbi:MAG: phospho-sugar mutase [Oscillospiraceae bacterium]|nr:phospho-sugar mutase [Oscillospiraceae bacterium]
MSYLDEYKKWKDSGVLTEAEVKELAAIENDPKEIESRFYALLEFGTAGLRGTLGIGTNRMNIYVVRHATQAFAEVILAEGPEAAEKGIAIAYDCRNFSTEFGRESACVMAANGIKVRLFDALRPTPELSFAIREYGCIAGINVTASHNPKEYNGYKVYWSDGAQLPPKHAAEIAERMQKNDVFASIKTMDYDEAVAAGLITIIGEETDEKFLANVMAQANDPETIAKVADDFKMVFTPFHGTGHKLIPEALHRLGIKHLYCEPEQMKIDGNFPTVKSPNPENPEGFYLAVELAKEKGADFIIGSDPDADRIGMMVKNDKGEYVVITGNQAGVLILDYLIGAKKRAGTLPENPVTLKSIVSTEMATKVAEVNGITAYSTFTGFKFMAEKKNQLEEAGEGKVIFSFEESYGYMFGDYVRDKDAVTAALIMTEMAAWYYAQGKTLYDALMEMYEKYGWYSEKTLNLVFPGLDGLNRMKEIMRDMREASPEEIAGVRVAAVRDYADGTRRTAEGVEKMELCGSNVLTFELEDGTTLIIRPSGTEPKIKVYILTQGESKEDCDAKVAKYVAWADGIK